MAGYNLNEWYSNTEKKLFKRALLSYDRNLMRSLCKCYAIGICPACKIEKLRKLYNPQDIGAMRIGYTREKRMKNT